MSIEIVARIVDGDTVVLAGQGEKLRLLGIDTPEMAQPYGQEAKVALEELIAHYPKQRLLVKRHGKDRYRRTLATLHDPLHPDESLNLAMIERGWAWYYAGPSGVMDPALDQRYPEAEGTARHRGRGIWHDPQLLPERPSEYRARLREQQKTKKEKKKRAARRR